MVVNARCTPRLVHSNATTSVMLAVALILHTRINSQPCQAAFLPMPALEFINSRSTNIRLRFRGKTASRWTAANRFWRENIPRWMVLFGSEMDAISIRCRITPARKHILFIYRFRVNLARAAANIQFRTKRSWLIRSDAKASPTQWIREGSIHLDPSRLFDCTTFFPLPQKKQHKQKKK